MKISTAFTYSPFVNYAMQQNHVSVVRKLNITNESEQDLHQIEIKLTAEPDFITTWTQHLDIIPKGTIYETETINLHISPTFLAGLSERLSGHLQLTISSSGKPIHQEVFPLAVLAYDQWGGIQVLPEMLAAFITPNHPEIPKIIHNAAQVLEKWTGNPSFDEYQSHNPDRVKKQMAAIFESIAQLQAIYCSVPASFEDSGQRIRLCDAIVSTKLANCLDLTLLYAACLEAVGIHPLIIIIKGHAFVGGWLINECFADPVNDDPSLLTKRTAAGINEIVLVEATAMNSGQNITFDEAVNLANHHLVNDDNFILFLDLKRTRFSGIRPMPLRIQTQGGWEIMEEAIPIDRTNIAPEILIDERIQIENGQVKISKQTLWERKLLDLTLRNSLLNLRITKSTLQFLAINLSKLEDALAEGSEFRILPKPTDWNNPLRNMGVYQALNQSDPVNDLINHEFSQKRLRSYLNDKELDYSLTNIYRASRLSIEENGANTLYIALGLLKWYETEVSERPRYAPLLLLPVEIVKKAAGNGYTIKSREEETMMNITLLEMLRQDFGINIGGLQNLPKDDNGVDVKLIFNIIRKAIMGKARWDVEEQAFLGTFSFNKFILWNDIHNNADKLSKNKIVKSLITGLLQIEENANANNGMADDSIHPSTLVLPISTDSSQLQAVKYSAENKSFVLHGPPGTGKSQTITNIIANALYQGKKVLFVAAKKAALDVVERRLEAIGIGAFCLELHSNKAKKSAVLEQLKKVAEINKKSSTTSFHTEAERLFNARKTLNEYVGYLHKKQGYGLSLFDTFSRYSALENTKDLVHFSNDEIEKLTESKLTEWTDLAEELQAIAMLNGDVSHHPLCAIQLRQYNQNLKNEAVQALENYIGLNKEYAALLNPLCTILKINPEIKSKQQANALKNMAGYFVSMPDIPETLMDISHAEQTLSKLLGIVEHGIKKDELRNSLLQDFNKEILTINAQQILNDWNIAENKWFLPKFFKQKSLYKSIKKLTLNQQLAKSKLPGILNQVIEYQNEKQQIDDATDVVSLLGFLAQGEKTDWMQIKIIAGKLLLINQEALQLTDTADTKLWRKRIAEKFTEGSKAYFAAHKKLLEDYITIYDCILKQETLLQNLLFIDFNQIYKVDENPAENALRHASSWKQNLDSLRDWVNWLQIKDKAIASGLSALITAFETGTIPPNELVNYFKKGLYRSCASHIIEKETVLANFNGKLFDEQIRKFRSLSTDFETLTKEELYIKLASQIPSFTQEAAQSSEIGILQRNIRNNGRATSIRKLFDSIPNLLPRLSPCMLMSPISVAQYFDSESEKFDLVIFDEASQMPTCEAVGAIARGSEVIIVGDPKQMPPTSFFSANNIDDDNIEIEDMESILDDCLALSMPSHHLLWHYRSKHESLIAFSNAKYYENKLLTFPSTDDISSKVTHVPVQGYYDKGKSRQNMFEAKATVDEIVYRLSHPELSKKSIGIVTFSSVQQILIDDLLSEVFKNRPDLEKIALESEEPIFIKNLENVQGDERDVILFSIAYGPDKDGKISLNFGPINRVGGWRRLNVAVSRARYEMKVFSTLSSEQIDLNRTSSEGVAGLKAFLAFAEKGKTALPNRSLSALNHQDAYTNMLAKKIKSYGYKVHENIGTSDYKIDIGIVDPKNPSGYILGILCDGQRYHAANNARDREIIQPNVLKLLGWNIYKVWSADWWENPERTVNGIIEAIKTAETGCFIEETPEPIVSPLPATIREEALNKLVQNTEVTATTIAFTPYEISNLTTDMIGSSEDFFLHQNREKIAAQILEVLDTESPMSKNLLTKRVLNAWGISRAGTRVTAHIEKVIDTLNIKSTALNQTIFLWKNEQNPEDYAMFRIPQSEAQKRDADDLPPEEIANGIKEILKNQISLPHAALLREGAKLFGYARIGNNVENAIVSGIKQAIVKGFAKVEGERIVLKE